MTINDMFSRYKTTGSTTATTGSNEPLSLEKILQVAKELNNVPKATQWVIIGPDGRIYAGTVEDVLPVLLAEHPLLKLPALSSFKRSNEES